jgi:hypothetical protein
MPGWKGELEDDEMWSIVRFLRHLPEKGSQGVPAVFKEAEEEHHEITQPHEQHGKPEQQGPPLNSEDTAPLPGREVLPLLQGGASQKPALDVQKAIEERPVALQCDSQKNDCFQEA